MQDVDSNALLNISKLDDSTNLRIMLILSSAGWSYVLLKNLISFLNLVENLNILWFYTQYTAIKYDEIKDNLDNMLKHSAHWDLLKNFIPYNQIFADQATNEIIAKLRNTIHYDISYNLPNTELFYSFLRKNNMSEDDFRKLHFNITSKFLKIIKIFETMLLV